MKVEATYCIEGYNTLEYDITDKVIEDYVQWCLADDYEVDDELNFLEYLREYVDFEEDLNIKNSYETGTTEVPEALSKCIKLANEYRRSKTEISGNNSETK